MIRFRIICEKSPGVLTKVVVGMRHAGIEIQRQNVDDDGDSRVLDIDFEASKEEAAKVYNSLKKVKGVFSVKVYMSKDRQQKSTSVTSRSTVKRVVEAFPDIGEVVANIHADLEPSLAGEQLFQLGLETAAARLDQGEITVADGSGSFSELINDTVVPELKKMGDVQYQEQGFETGLMMMSSVFTKTEASSSLGGTFGTLSEEVIRCDFLCGYIAGITNAAAGKNNNSYEVSEVRCRNEGHPYCLFDFES